MRSTWPAARGADPRLSASSNGSRPPHPASEPGGPDLPLRIAVGRDDRTRLTDTLFGRVAARRPRWRLCGCDRFEKQPNGGWQRPTSAPIGRRATPARSLGNPLRATGGGDRAPVAHHRPPVNGDGRWGSGHRPGRCDNRGGALECIGSGAPRFVQRSRRLPGRLNRIDDVLMAVPSVPPDEAALLKSEHDAARANPSPPEPI